MASVNKVILVGNLGRDPEVRYNPDGFTVANVSIATTSSWKDKNTGERRDETEWHRVVFYNRQAEIVGQYLKKGSQVYIEGRLKTRKYTGKDGIERYATEIVADTMQMLGGRNANMGDSPADDQYAEGASNGGGQTMALASRRVSHDDGGFANQGTAPQMRASAPASQPVARPAAPKAAESVGDLDEDIPF